MKRGTLVSFEGLDGSGKSTQLARLAAYLESQGLDVVSTREPTDGAVGRRIRAHARTAEQVPPEQELAWFMQDRTEHVRELIAPALERGAVVLCDRFTLSSVAYQGARGLDFRSILAANEASNVNGEIIVWWKNVKPAAQGHKHLPITIVIFSWDPKGMRHETRYNLLAVESSSSVDVTDSIAPGVMLGGRTTVTKSVWLLKLFEKARRLTGMMS